MKRKITMKRVLSAAVCTTLLVGSNTSFAMAESTTVTEDVTITEGLDEELTEDELIEDELIQETTSNTELVVETPEEYGNYYHDAISTTPVNGATNVSTDIQTIKFIFDKKLPVFNLNEGNTDITITHYENGVEKVDTIDPSKATFYEYEIDVDVSDYNFSPNTQYTVDLFFSDLSLNIITGVFDYWRGSTTFTTAPLPPAEVVGTTPNLNNTTIDYIEGLSKIKISFNKPMKTSQFGDVTITDNTIGMTYKLDPAYFYWEDNKNCVVDVRFTDPRENVIQMGHSYTLTISNFKDIDGFTSPTKNYNFQVNTPHTPEVVSTTPDLDGTTVSYNEDLSNVKINFDTEMNPYPGSQKVMLTDNTTGKTEVLDKGTWNFSNGATDNYTEYTVNLSRRVDIVPGHSYTLTLASFQSAIGMDMPTTKYNFEVATNPELNEQAEVTGTSITNGQSDVPTNLSEITIDFSHAMNPNIPVTTENVRLINLSDGSTQEDNLDLGNAVWSNGNKTLTIPLNGNLEPQTLYQVEIDGFKPQEANVSPTELYEVSFFTAK